MQAQKNRWSIGATVGLEGLNGATQRGLTVAFAASIAVVMGVQMVYPVLPALMFQLGVDDTAIGLVIAVYTAPAIVLAPVFGILTDRHGRRPMLLTGLLLFGLAGDHCPGAQLRVGRGAALHSGSGRYCPEPTHHRAAE